MAKTPQTLAKRLRERAKQMKRLAKIAKRQERNATKREAKKALENAPPPGAEGASALPSDQAAVATAPAAPAPTAVTP